MPTLDDDAMIATPALTDVKKKVYNCRNQDILGKKA